jgi:FKBP-type peptidyl-prolyl cis-trans isomerase
MPTEQTVIEEVKTGTGPAAKAGDAVSVHYTGTLTNGSTFDSSRTRGKPFRFTLGQGQVIAGWDIGVAGMQVGGIRKLVIPPHEAYGARAVGPIPPNSTLQFEVELLAIG